MSTVYIGIGSNLGDRLDNLRQAVNEIANRTGAELDAESRVYETAPYGMAPGAGNFLNAVIRIQSSTSPGELLTILRGIEQDMGRPERRPRTGGSHGGYYASRTIDLDILAWDDLVLDTAELTLPHPGLPDRRFVLEPLNDIAPGWEHPVTGKTVKEMLRNCRGSCADPIEERL